MITEINTISEQKCREKRIMMYPIIFDTVNGKQVSIETIIDDIRNKSSRKLVRNKKELPVAFFSVLGFNGNKTHDNVTGHSGFIVIDIDKHDNPNTDFELLYNDIQWGNFTYACFRSPSKGIKLIIITDIQDINHHEAYFQAITEYLLNHYRKLDKIDTSGSNINRACYLPYDPHAYLNPYAEIFKVSDEYIQEYLKNNHQKLNSSSSPKPLLQVEYLSYQDHYENLQLVVNNYTSFGINESITGTSAGIEINKEGTLLGIDENENIISMEINNGTLVGDAVNNSLGTSVGLYDCIFNEFRYHNIRDSVMSTNVPLFELLFEFLFLEYSTPSKVERETRLDEIYFKDYPEMRLSTDDFEGFDGLEVCEIKSLGAIPEGKRGKTLTVICMKLIFNNPFCHPSLIAKELQSINYHYSEDYNPDNPAPDNAEINAIVATCYQKFINGELDFIPVIRKKKNFKDISKRKVFCSIYHEKMRPEDKQKCCYKTYTEGKRGKNLRQYEKAINELQDGKKITVSRIAEYMEMSRKQVSRYRTDEKYKPLMEAIQTKIDAYNRSLTIND